MSALTPPKLQVWLRAEIERRRKEREMLTTGTCARCGKPDRYRLPVPTPDGFEELWCGFCIEEESAAWTSWRAWGWVVALVAAVALALVYFTS